MTAVCSCICLLLLIYLLVFFLLSPVQTSEVQSFSNFLVVQPKANLLFSLSFFFLERKQPPHTQRSSSKVSLEKIKESGDGKKALVMKSYKITNVTICCLNPSHIVRLRHCRHEDPFKISGILLRPQDQVPGPQQC